MACGQNHLLGLNLFAMDTSIYEEIRTHFRGLDGIDVLLDNAGGSQVPRAVADAVRDYMLTSYVQPGADYATSKKSTSTIERARKMMTVFVNGEHGGRVAFGASTSSLLARLAGCYGGLFDQDRPEIIVAESGHESNVGPWVRLTRFGYTIRL